MKKSSVEELYFLPLGGAAEIGMNLNLYGYGGKWLMVDLGISFHDGIGLDVVMPNPQFIVERRTDLAGLLLTHAHEDHIGAIPYLWQQLRCPIYATPFTAGLVRYKLKEANLLNEVQLIEIPLQGHHQIGPFDIEMVRLTHSIPEPNGVLIKTPAGAVFHTGDWKIDPDPLVGEATDADALKRIGDEGVLAMVCDSTNVFHEGRAGSEKEVQEALVETVGKYPNVCVAVTCFASNVARLQSIAHAAQENGRKVVMVGRSFERMQTVARANGYLADTAPFLTVEEAQDIPRHELLYMCTGSQGEGRSALKRIADGSYRGVSLNPDDVVIFSSRMIPGNEKKISALKNGLLRQGVHVVTQRQAEIHVSGHPGREELMQMYEWVRPKIAIPVHGELQHLLEHRKLARKCGVEDIIIVDNGSLVRVGPGVPEIIEEVPSGRLALDGDAVVRLDHPALKDREKLAFNGVVSVTVAFSDSFDLAYPITVTMMGLVNVDNVVQACIESITNTIDDMPFEDREEESEVKKAVLQSVKKTFMQHMQKRPVTMVHILYL